MQDLLNFYRAKKHGDVLRLIEDCIEINKKYETIEGELFKLYIPKTLDILTDKLPLITAHSDTVFIEQPFDFRIEKIGLGTKISSADQMVGIGGDCRNGCYLISQIMRSDAWDKFIFAIFDLEEIGGVGARTMPYQSIINNNVSYLIGLDCYARDYIAVYNNTETSLIDNIIRNFDDKKVTRGYFTDVVVLADKYEKSPIVISIGYYNQHSPNEYVIYEDLEECYKTIIRFANLDLDEIRENVV